MPAVIDSNRSELDIDMLETLHRLFDYDAWANREALAALRRAAATPARSLKLLAHVIGAQLLWLARLRGESASVVGWPEMTIQECEAGIGQLQRLWMSYLGEQTAESLSNPVAYTNSQGESFTSAVEDIHRAYSSSSREPRRAEERAVQGARRRHIGGTICRRRATQQCDAGPPPPVLAAAVPPGPLGCWRRGAVYFVARPRRYSPPGHRPAPSGRGGRPSASLRETPSRGPSRVGARPPAPATRPRELLK